MQKKNKPNKKQYGGTHGSTCLPVTPVMRKEEIERSQSNANPAQKHKTQYKKLN
jgi:hypothetical protein